MYLCYPFFSYIVIIRSIYLFYLFIYFMQGRFENHSCENAPCLKIIIIIIIIKMCKIYKWDGWWRHSINVMSYQVYK